MPVWVRDFSPASRQQYMVEEHVGRRESFMERKGRCGVCALTVAYCVCGELNKLSLDNFSFSVAVLMNTNEKYRSSNTAKVIEKVLDAKLLISQVPADEETLDELLSKHAENCFVLFPSEDSQSFEDLPVFAEPPLIILLDGTWRQARRLNQRIPASVPRVKVNPNTLSQFLCRRQTMPGRVCTVEALSLVLKDMHFETESCQLEKGLNVLVEGFNKQCYGSSLRPPCMLKKLPAGKNLPPRHPASLIDSDPNKTHSSKPQHSQRRPTH